MKEEEMFKNLIKILDDLCKRLQDDYNGIDIFEQYEEDRLAVYNVIEILEKTKKFVDYQLSTYPCNENLEIISNCLVGNFDGIEFLEK